MVKGHSLLLAEPGKEKGGAFWLVEDLMKRGPEADLGQKRPEKKDIIKV